MRKTKKKNLFAFIVLMLLTFMVSEVLLAQNVTDTNGKKQGQWEKQYPNGQSIYRGQFKDDIPYGTFKYFDKSGVITSLLKYSSGDTAVASFFHGNGKKSAYGYYVNQKKEGVWRFYDRNGIIASEEEYAGGFKHGKYLVFNLNGSISRETYFVNGVENGYRKTFDSNGKLLTEGTIKDGQMDGEQIIYRNGVINIKGSYKHAVQDGEWIYYDAEGKPYNTEHYELGYKKN